MKNIFKKSYIYIAFKLLTILGSLSYIMVFAAINGTLGMILASMVTISGSLGIAKGLNEFLNIGTYISTPYYVFIIICCVCGFFRGILRYFEQYSNHFIAFKLLASIRDKLFKALRRLAPSKLDDYKKGSLLSMITADVETLEVFYAHTLSPIVICFLFFIASFLFIGFISSFYLSLVLLFSYLLLGIILPFIYSRKLNFEGSKYRKSFSSFNSYFLDNIKGVKEISMNNAISSKLKEVENRNDQILLETKKIKHYNAINTSITEMSITLCILISLSIGIYLSLYQNLPINLMIVGIVTIFSSFGPVLALANLPSTLNQTFASASRVISLLNEKPLVDEVNDKNNFTFKSLKVKNLSFKYPNTSKIVLDNINLEVNEFDVVGIKGPSGCGKSTLLKQLLRFYPIAKDKVFYNDIDINDINTSSLLDNVTMVSQLTYLFDDTILNNLKIAKNDASLDEIYDACKKASIHVFIMSLKDGYNSKVGQLGDLLSAGEKQRIGLARAFLRNSKLILLDEPTSNVDAINEGIILKAIKDSKDKTFILVSHRESTMSICNKVYVFEDGKLTN